MSKKLRISEAQLSELKAGKSINVTKTISPAPSMLTRPYQWNTEKPNWYSGQGLMSCSHKCHWGTKGDRHTAGNMEVEVVKVWADLKDPNRPVHWKNNPWMFYATLKLVQLRTKKERTQEHGRKSTTTRRKARTA